MEKITHYLFVWVVLIILTITEVIMITSPMNLSLILSIIVSLAAIKAILIALYYQHLKYEAFSLSIFYLSSLFFIVIIMLTWTLGM